MSTDTSEKGLEALIVRAMTGRTDLLAPPHPVTDGAVPVTGGTGWLLGDPAHYDREYCIDLVQLRGFLLATQPELVETFALDTDGPTRRKFLARLQGQISARGVIDVLRHGIKHGPQDVPLFYGTPTPGNATAEERFGANRFSVTRQLRYSRDETALSLDLGLFLNGLPVFTFELKNSLTKQTVADAIEQYRRDRDPREKLFEFGRCVAHFAVDDAEVRFCTHLKGKGSWFLPFNRGYNDGAGNPPNPEGLKTDYLWKRILTPAGLTDILENYAQVVERKDPKTRRVKRDQIFPRYHQLDVLRRLLADAGQHGAGKRYLIQHSAGSGKSNSIAWLAHQLIGLRKGEQHVFDSIIVVTDRRILDQQIRDSIKQFAQVGATLGHAEHSGDLRRFLTAGKKIIITTVQKFPFILDEIGSDHAARRFAILIDEAHSSQGGKTSAAMSRALAGMESDEEETTEDQINKIMEGRKLLKNASYFAFTATPKNKTLETFGTVIPGEVDADGAPRRRAFHSYTMKQAIDEGFILDVLRYYTPVQSYYKLVKTVEGDPEFDTKKAQKKLRRYVESHEHAIRLKAEIMVDHFHDQVLLQNKIGGKARAMVVCNGIERAIQYFLAFRAYLVERKSPYQAIVAFSGEHELDGKKETEATLNGFPSGDIADRIQEDPYRFLICADKFQTGYDEPLLHTMYVDKTLAGVKAVQTLSRLNRAHPQKHDVFVLDFMNDTEAIRASFEPFYRTTVLSGETDPNKLHDLKDALDARQVYDPSQVEELVARYLGGADRDQLDPILDACVAAYDQELDEDGQIDFKGKAKAFARTYAFLSAILPYSNVEWEKLSIFLNFLIPKLPAPEEEDLSKGILESIDMDSYRTEKQATMKLVLADEDGEVDPVPVSGGGRKPEPELDRLSNILKAFNEHFGNIPWQDADRVRKLITEEIPQRVAQDVAYQNARKNSDKQNARIEHDKALLRVILGLMKDDTELFKQFTDNPGFKRWLSDMVFNETYDAPEAA
ncbi:type I restriction endonuclease subunit R [Myxococcota bacterium]|nr:type I restriction endonuclease subunit R [Myxococcota bacterium]MCK6565413.1 type I restriction endonuclease subunit R [Dehalococcoidia bacterium]